MPLRTGTQMPEVSGATEWIGSAPRAEDLAGHPVLIHFWAVSCSICHENMPAVHRWRDGYGPLGLKVVAVHMPRQESDTDIASVRRDADAIGLVEPCAIDNEHAIAEAFQNEWVPAYYLFDREGCMRSRAAGHAGTGMLEGALKRMFDGG